MSEHNSCGRFVWHELATTDPEAAAAFYAALFGWTAVPFEASNPPYTMFMLGEAPVAGLMRLPAEAAAAGAPPYWMGYVGVTDVDATTAKAQELGAMVLVPRIDIPNMGSFTILQDPQGPVIAPWQAASVQAGPEREPAVGEFSWNELLTGDFEAAFAFYSALFAWKKLAAIDMGPAGIYQLYGASERPLGGMFNKSPDMPAPHCWTYYVRVPAVNQAAEKVKELGGKLLMDPTEVPGGDWIVPCLDPQGAAFALHQKANGG